MEENWQRNTDEDNICGAIDLWKIFEMIHLEKETDYKQKIKLETMRGNYNLVTLIESFLLNTKQGVNKSLP